MPDPATSPAAETPARLNKKLVVTFAWSVALSAAAIALIGFLTDFDVDALGVMWQRLNGGLLALALLMLGVRTLFGAWRLQYVSEGTLDFTHSLRGQLAWEFFSAVTPSAIGGGPFTAVYVAQDRGIPVGEATAILLYSMLLDQFWTAASVLLLLLALPFMPVFPTTLGFWGMASLLVYFACMLAWTVLFAYTLLRRPELLEKMVGYVFRLKWLQRYQEQVSHHVHQLAERASVLRARGFLFYLNGFLITVGSWLGRYLMLFFLVWSVHPGLEKTLFLVRSVAMTLGSLILPTPGGAGGVEGFYVLFLEPLMPDVFLAPTLLVWRVLGFYLFIALGAFISLHSMRQAHLRTRRGVSAPVPEPVPVAEEERI